MSLVKCAKCEREISDKAPNCVHCGVSTSKPEPRFAAKPNPLIVFEVMTLMAVFLHIAFHYISGRPLYPLEIVSLIYSKGIFIPPLVLSILFASALLLTGFLATRNRSQLLKKANAAISLLFCAGSFMAFADANIYGLVWQQNVDGLRIPISPFLFLISSIHLLCFILLLLPKSSKYFNYES